MGIKIENNFFTLSTKNSSFQFCVDERKALKHVWYGPKTECNMDYLLKYHDTGLSGNPYDAVNERSYSFDTMPLEISTLGNGDFRINSLAIDFSDGTKNLDLRYYGYEILKHKMPLENLPSSYANENEKCDSIKITLKDTTQELYAHLFYSVFEDDDIIARHIEIQNKTGKTFTIQNAQSLNLDFANFDDAQWIHFYGRHCMERNVERVDIIHGIQEASSIRGVSSMQQNPSFILCSKDTTENSGICYGAALIYSGNFSARIQKDQLNQIRATLGINSELFLWRLEDGKTFVTPEAIMTFSNSGFSKLSHNFHHFINNNIVRGKFKNSCRPILINNWEATYFDFNDEKITEIAKAAAELGIELFVLDDGWFGNRNNDMSGLGDWQVNENKIKCGMKKLSENINALGMKFGLWFEPEMVSEDSNLYRTHPEWTIKVPNKNPTRSRFQLVLNLSLKEVQDYIINSLSAILDDAKISYIKWDMNRHITDWYSPNLSAEKMGEFSHRYVLGLYKVMDALVKKYPDVLFEGCSSGGGRFDLGILSCFPQIWCSDNTDAIERTFIQYGTSFIYPVSTMGSHVSAVPNHQTGRTVSLNARSTVASAGTFGYELDVSKLTEEEKNLVKKQTAHFKKHQKLIQQGKYSRLSDPNKKNYCAWQFTSGDETEILVAGIIYKAASNVQQNVVKLLNLEQNKIYECGEKFYTTHALLCGGLLLPPTNGDWTSFEFYLKAE